MRDRRIERLGNGGVVERGVEVADGDGARRAPFAFVEDSPADDDIAGSARNCREIGPHRVAGLPHPVLDEQPAQAAAGSDALDLQFVAFGRG
ncbi:MAG: hypothetical protein M5U09_25370 [Gammaproteobacteria bacterium]|nr:hypothetical protein [Gammaproteobacteria bacterium]